MAAELELGAAEGLLERGEFEDCRPFWYSSNSVFMAQMCGPGEERFAAIYKPQRGESPLWDFPEGTLYRREVAASRLSRLLGWEFVPPTVAREGPNGMGSVQWFVRHDTESHFFEQRSNPALVPQLQRMATFDVIANNADRKGGHCLLADGGQIWGIDHGLCFHQQYKMRTVMWDWAQEPIAEEWLADAERAGKGLARGRSKLAKAVLEMISADEALAMLGRIERLLLERRFPEPGPHRSYPWPLV